jgi:Protein of unknown function (DUF2997)
MKKIVIEFQPDGVSKIDAEGFQGQSCALATRELELALVGNQNDVDRKPKPDFYATTGASNTLSR